VTHAYAIFHGMVILLLFICGWVQADRHIKLRRDFNNFERMTEQQNHGALMRFARIEGSVLDLYGKLQALLDVPQAKGRKKK